MIKRVAYMALAAWAVCLYSCKDIPSNNHGPIVLGDSSSIVTENDRQKLQDLVTDLKPDIPSSEKKDTDEDKPAIAPDTDKKTKVITPPPSPLRLPAGTGLLAEFKEVSVLIPNVNAKLAGKPDLQRANGVVYTLVSGNLNGNLVRLTGNVTKVSQRCQTVVLLKSNRGTIQLDAFTSTSDWAPLKGGNGQYRITGLDPQSLDYPDAGAAAIRNAVTKAARRRRLSRRATEEMLNSVHHVRSLNQKPLAVTLRSVMWKIEGKDAQGKNFTKQVRIDIPL